MAIRRWSDRIADGRRRVAELRRRFVATPYRPTGTTSSAEALAFLVDELDWLRVIVVRRAAAVRDICPGENCETVAAAIAVLRAGAARLAGSEARPDLERVLVARDAGVKALLRNIRQLPGGGEDSSLASVLEPSFRAHQLSYAAWELGANALLATGTSPPGTEADRRSIPAGPRGAHGCWPSRRARAACGSRTACAVPRR